MRHHSSRRKIRASLKGYCEADDHRASRLMVAFSEHERDMRRSALPVMTETIEPDFDIPTMTSLAWSHGETPCRIAIRREDNRFLNFTALPMPEPMPRHC